MCFFDVKNEWNYHFFDEKADMYFLTVPERNYICGQNIFLPW